MIATSLMVQRSLEAAEQLAEEGIELEVVDPRTLKPLDDEPIVESVIKTGRAMVVHEAVHWRLWRRGRRPHRRQPGVRLPRRADPHGWAGLDIPIPYNRHLEANTVPQVDNIVREARGSSGGEY